MRSLLLFDVFNFSKGDSSISKLSIIAWGDISPLHTDELHVLHTICFISLEHFFQPFIFGIKFFSCAWLLYMNFSQDTHIWTSVVFYFSDKKKIILLLYTFCSSLMITAKYRHNLFDHFCSWYFILRSIHYLSKLHNAKNVFINVIFYI